MERVVQRLREQAGRNASERRAGLETVNVGADPPQKRGRPPSLVNTEGLTAPHRSDPIQRSHRGNGDGMSAQGDPTQHGKPQAVGRVTPNRTPARDRPGRLGWRTGP